MGALSLLAVASMPVAEVLLLGTAGAWLASARCGVLTATARADINRVVYAVFTPALMLSSLARTVTLRDAISWWFMPLNIGIVFLVGGLLGWLLLLLLRPPRHLRGLVVASCSAANFGNLLLIVIPSLCRQQGNPFTSSSSSSATCAERGLSYVSFSMALGGFYIWTHTYIVMKKSAQIYHSIPTTITTASTADSPTQNQKDQEEAAAQEELLQPTESFHEKQLLLPMLSSHHIHTEVKSGGGRWEKVKECMHQIMEELTAPPTMGAVVGFIIGAVPWLKSALVGDSAPLRPVYDSLKLLGDGTIPCVTLILGGNLTKGRGSRRSEAAVSPAVVVGIVCVRYIILPVVGMGVVSAARRAGLLPPDPLYQYVLMIQFALPPAMSIGTMSQLYDVAQEECSLIFLWTYLVAAIALTLWSSVFMSILSST